MILQRITEAIAKSGQTRYQISQDTGVKQTVLFRIVHGGSCSMETADKLCEYLGLDLRPRGAKER
jgi:ribosome-binding protein aMBF1 (putative translation factor)